MVTTWRTAFPDLQMVIEDLVVSGDKAAARYTVSGTHLGELWGNQPTGKRFRIEQIYIVRVAAGRIVETWGVWDQYGFWRQLAFPFEP
jgi:predicted ester cyclase